MRKIMCLILVTCCLFALCSCKNQTDIDKYVTNYSEFETAISAKFNNPKFTSTPNYETDIASLKEFGKGNYWLCVNDVPVCVYIDNSEAYCFMYNDGKSKQWCVVPAAYDSFLERKFANKDIVLNIENGIVVSAESWRGVPVCADSDGNWVLTSDFEGYSAGTAVDIPSVGYCFYDYTAMWVTQ